MGWAHARCWVAVSSVLLAVGGGSAAARHNGITGNRQQSVEHPGATGAPPAREPCEALGPGRKDRSRVCGGE
ncbi:hypothetical protein NDU88_008053 [Pleurodeles waltl]|uniref:Secreted protein n=1 Tax=Pleurodeles waltl TaxID=8319 RepID=A0AAV7RWJ0_PLEWA|nr:hypothetical protein NDU88_008053 [Pleurodeles waltl]